jgi:two-component system, response regulator YesN
LQTAKHTAPVVVRLSLIELAVLVNLSPSRLRTIFKAETGLTIPQYVKQLKMQRARELVRETFLRVSEIAAYLEFDDPSYFVREFKRTFGQTPNAYRQAGNSSHEQAPQPMNSQPTH